MRSVAKLNGRGRASPGCNSVLAKSIVRPLIRQGVPVLKRASSKPQERRPSLSVSADWSPALPPRVLLSPVCIKALRKVPVVKTTALARYSVSPRAVTPITRRNGEGGTGNGERRTVDSSFSVLGSRFFVSSSTSPSTISCLSVRLAWASTRYFIAN